jgi:glutamate-1-semialdehyde 2,1-aminomutase
MPMSAVSSPAHQASNTCISLEVAIKVAVSSQKSFGTHSQARNFAASSADMAAARNLIPGGAHTYARGDDQYPAGMAPVIQRGDGCRVWDIDRNEYIEYGSGLRANLLGHGFAPLLRAVQTAMAHGISFTRPHRLELEAAERFIELIPSAEMVKFGLNGSDVTTAAVRLARA